ncbi:hypothetical protein ACFQGT_03585 [Natrialbaceae archaeon GCM10025810]|uniref:DUF7344 domain-containing protein n=1 Tax=Halovalidus salilacus TaxID=3075124 RepID=UPI003613297C
MSPNDGRNGERSDDRANSSVDDSELSLNAILEVLAHHHRREIVRILAGDPNETASVRSLTERLLERERERTGVIPGRQGIETSLYHVHLPKLADAELVEYDPPRKTVRYRPNERVREILKHLRKAESE